jgi:NADH dehydrogenase
VKIAVTGGTGFVGRHLVNRLLQDSHSITVLTHRNSGENIFDNRVRIVPGSVDSTSKMATAFQDCQVVFHLVGIIAETKRNTFEKTVDEGTRNVVTACREAQVKKIIYLSSMGTSEKAATAYHKTKYAAERHIKNSGLDSVIFRPSIIYGKGDGFLTLMSKLIKFLPFVPIFGDGQYQLQPVYIDDLTSAMAQAVNNPQASGQIIDIGGPEQLGYVTVINTIKKILAKKRLNLHIPFGVIKPVAAVMEFFLKPAPLTLDQLKMLRMGNTGDITKMRAIFGIEPVRFEDGLKRIIGEKVNG